MADYDVVVVGGGPAGLSAGALLARCRRRTLVVDAGRPRNRQADHVCCFHTRDGTPPFEMRDLGRAEVRRYGGSLRDDTVTALGIDGTGSFTVAFASGYLVTARQVIIATGATEEMPAGVSGLSERWGCDVVACPYCHGWDLRDQPVGVLGVSDRSIGQALTISIWTDNLILFRHRIPELEASDLARLRARGITLHPGVVAGVRLAEGRLAAIELTDGVSVPRSALFIAPTVTLNHGLVTGLGGTVSDDGTTSIPGLWVAHTGPKAILAAGNGVQMAIAANQTLLDEDIRNAA